MNPNRLENNLRNDDSDDLRRRRAVITWSLFGMAALGAVSLLQTGVIRHLPDPPLPGFDSDKVNTSETAYRFGVPDGPIGVLDFAANLPLAAYGDADRAEKQPVVPILAAGKALADAAGASWYFAQMPLKEKAWCAYCIAAAVANWGIALLTIPEARRALSRIRQG